jgi:putative transcriptional regulator
MRKSRILAEVHETAKGLHDIGLLPDVTMREFDRLCLPPVHEMAPTTIKRLREHAHVSQGVFAAYLNTSLSTVQKWETGQKKPRGIALKMLNLIEQKGLAVVAG